MAGRLKTSLLASPGKQYIWHFRDSDARNFNNDKDFMI